MGKGIKFIALLLGGLLMLSACNTTQKLTGPEKRKLHKQFETSQVFSGAFTGFALFDPLSRKMLFQKNADKYFTPASNTKILTLYTSLKVLGDSIALFHYQIMGDSLIIWGSGNPLFLHPEMPQETTSINFLTGNKQKVFFSDFNFHDKRYGPGWAWDDYPYYYQAEKSPFPIYGNMLSFQKDSTLNKWQVFPSFFLEKIKKDETPFSKWPYVRRNWNDNQFYFNDVAAKDSTFRQDLPFLTSPELFVELLEDTLKKEISYLKTFPKKTSSSLWAPLTDTIYRRLMQDSDNFIAEQLMLMCADRLFDTLNTRMAIDYAQNAFFQDLPDPLQWFDGSGLSRYNLFTPRSVVRILEKLFDEWPEERLFSIFPAGGQSGSIRNWYGNGGQPYVFAKTGTLSNRHCLSGYLKTNSGKVLIFSFMHNNFIKSSAEYKKEMQSLLKWIKQNY